MPFSAAVWVVRGGAVATYGTAFFPMHAWNGSGVRR